MIQAELTVHGSTIRSLVISGHAESGEYGSDLICAAASAIAFGICNTLDELGSTAECAVKDNRIEILNCPEDIVTQTVMNTALIQLETLREGRNQYLDIRKTEV
ncbi:MAG: ribosomal-processing cysteine protease Prp [Solobacterium sp.]|nr:ribosomal-processing cysteine protease Prp [Solobacterium sp.]